MNDLRLPKPNERVVGADGRITRPWLDFLRNLAAVGSVEELQAILARAEAAIAELEQSGGLPANTKILGDQSIDVNGILANGVVTLSLVNDQTSPEPLSYYGTDDVGTKGYHLMPDPPDSGFLPMTTGEIVDGQPIFLYGPDGRLIYGPVI